MIRFFVNNRPTLSSVSNLLLPGHSSTFFAKATLPFLQCNVSFSSSTTKQTSSFSSSSTTHLVPSPVGNNSGRKNDNNQRRDEFEHQQSFQTNHHQSKKFLYEQSTLKDIMSSFRKLEYQQKKSHHGQPQQGNNNNKSKHKDKFTKHRDLFQDRQRYSQLSMRLTASHFYMMSLKELSLLLKITSSLSPVDGASHVASGITSALPKKLQQADVYDCTESVIQLLTIVKHSAHNKTNLRTGKEQQFRSRGMSRHSRSSTTGFDLVADTELVAVVNMTIRRLSSHFLEAAENTKRQEEDEKILRRENKSKNKNKTKENDQTVTTSQEDGIKKTPNTDATTTGTTHQAENHQSRNLNPNPITYYDDSKFRRRVILQFLSKSNDKRLEHLFGEQPLAKLLVRILSDAKAFNIDKRNSSSQSSDDARHNRPQLSALVAVVATSICRLRLLNPTVVDFFKWAAPICMEEVDLLSGNQLSYILDAFSLVGYHHPALFVALGEKAGELGESLREDEVARVLIALDRTKIEHSKLRASLESSMRMRNLHKSSPTMGNLF